MEFLKNELIEIKYKLMLLLLISLNLFYKLLFRHMKENINLLNFS